MNLLIGKKEDGKIKVSIMAGKNNEVFTVAGKNSKELDLNLKASLEKNNISLPTLTDMNGTRFSQTKNKPIKCKKVSSKLLNSVKKTIKEHTPSNKTEELVPC